MFDHVGVVFRDLRRSGGFYRRAIGRDRHPLDGGSHADGRHRLAGVQHRRARSRRSSWSPLDRRRSGAPPMPRR